MSQAQHASDPVSAAFGADRRDVSYESIAAQVRTMQSSALIPSQFDDVTTLIEWLRDETLKLHDRVQADAKRLAEREAAVTQRERAIKHRERVHDAATRSRELLRYFRR